MALNYANQSLVYLLGDFGTPVTLTNNYVDNVSQTIDTNHFAEAAYYIEYVGTPGDTLQMKFEYSPDDSYELQHFAQELFDSVTGGVMTLTPGERIYVNINGTDRVRFFAPPADRFLKVSVKENAAGAHGTLILRALLSGK